MSRGKVRTRRGKVRDSRAKARERRTDYGTILLHWTLVVSLVVAFLTGLRIASEAPDRTWVNVLDMVLPRSVVWTAHMPAAVVLVTVAAAYAFYIALSGLAGRVRLDRTRLVGLFGKRQARWGAINVLLHWTFFASLMLQLVTGGMLYFGYAENLILVLHWFGTWAIVAYAALHVFSHWRLGGVTQLMRMFRPAPLVAPPPALDPVELLVMLAERSGPATAAHATSPANAAPRRNEPRNSVSPPRGPVPEQNYRPANGVPRHPPAAQHYQPANAGPGPRQAAAEQHFQPTKWGPFPLLREAAAEQHYQSATGGPVPLPAQPAAQQYYETANGGPLPQPRQPTAEQYYRPANSAQSPLPRQPAAEQHYQSANSASPPHQPAALQTNQSALGRPLPLPRQATAQQANNSANSDPFPLPPVAAAEQPNVPASVRQFPLSRPAAATQPAQPAEARPFSLARPAAAPQPAQPSEARPSSLPRPAAAAQPAQPAEARPSSLPRPSAAEQTDRRTEARPFPLPRPSAAQPADQPTSARQLPLMRPAAAEDPDPRSNTRPFPLQRPPASEQRDPPASARPLILPRQGVRSAGAPPRRRDPIVQANPLIVALSLAIVGAFFLVTIDRNSIDTLEVRRIEAAEAPVLDGDTSDPVWRTASPLYVTTSQGGNFDGSGQTTIEIRAVHDDKQAYFLFAWDDPTRSLKQLPMIKKADGWHVLHQGYEIGDEHDYNEDKFSVLFTTMDVVLAGDRTFHAGAQPIADAPRTLSGRGLHYTMAEGAYADVWEWKATSTNPSGYLDDDHFGPPAEPTEAERRGLAPYHGGFAPDPGTAGYMDNFTQRPPSGYDEPLKPRRLPNDVAAMQAVMGPIDLDPEHGEREDARWFMTEGESAPYSAETDARIPVGTVIPGVIAAGTFSGDRGDVRCAARWAAGRWALEVTRRLDTHSQYDIPIKSGVFMRVAAFDHNQIRHTRHVRPIRLEVQ